MILHVHPDNPQERLLKQAVKVLESGGVIVYPTDTVYGMGCDVENRKAIDRLHQLKQVDPRKPMSLICPDLSVLSSYSVSLPTPAFRILKRLTPGPYTFVLEASTRVPRTLLNRQRTIGIRVPENAICQMLARLLGRPLLNTSITLEDENHVVEDPEDIYEQWGSRVDMVIGGGILVAEHSSVIDLTGSAPVILREGKGDLSSLR